MSEKFDIVLYFKRKASVEPTKPVFDDVKRKNGNISLDDQLSIFHTLVTEYNQKLATYQKTKIDKILSTHTFIKEDEDFIINVKNFEEQDFFIEWEIDSIETISNTLINLV